MVIVQESVGVIWVVSAEGHSEASLLMAEERFSPVVARLLAVAIAQRHVANLGPECGLSTAARALIPTNSYCHPPDSE